MSLASVKSRLVLPFWYRLTLVVLEKGPLNGCVCVCVWLFDYLYFQQMLLFERFVFDCFDCISIEVYSGCADYWYVTLHCAWVHWHVALHCCYADRWSNLLMIHRSTFTKKRTKHLKLDTQLVTSLWSLAQRTIFRTLSNDWPCVIPATMYLRGWTPVVSVWLPVAVCRGPIVGHSTRLSQATVTASSRKSWLALVLLSISLNPVVTFILPRWLWLSNHVLHLCPSFTLMIIQMTMSPFQSCHWITCHLLPHRPTRNLPPIPTCLALQITQHMNRFLCLTWNFSC